MSLVKGTPCFEVSDKRKPLKWHDAVFRCYFEQRSNLLVFETRKPAPDSRHLKQDSWMCCRVSEEFLNVRFDELQGERLDSLILGWDSVRLSLGSYSLTLYCSSMPLCEESRPGSMYSSQVTSKDKYESILLVLNGHAGEEGIEPSAFGVRIHCAASCATPQELRPNFAGARGIPVETLLNHQGQSLFAWHGFADGPVSRLLRSGRRSSKRRA